MTRIFTLTIATVALALTLVAASWAKPDQAPVTRLSDANERAALGGTPGDRSRGLNRLYGLGEYATATTMHDAFERAAASQPNPGVSDRSIALNRFYGLGEFAPVSMRDVHDRMGPVNQPVSTPTIGSGRDVEWPQLGIGFGVGILLAFGLILATRLARVRQLAH